MVKGGWDVFTVGVIVGKGPDKGIASANRIDGRDLVGRNQQLLVLSNPQSTAGPDRDNHVLDPLGHEFLGRRGDFR